MNELREELFIPFEERQTIEQLPLLRSQTYSDVLIDVDSCLTSIEGIDELARIRNSGPEIAILTRAAMEGEIPLEEVFEKRLQLINPRYEDFMHVAGLYMAYATRDSVRTIELLQESGVNIHLISGGYEPAIMPLAKFLGIPTRNVYANKLFFKNHRDYDGFDKNVPLWKQNGKKRQ